MRWRPDPSARGAGARRVLERTGVRSYDPVVRSWRTAASIGPVGRFAGLAGSVRQPCTTPCVGSADIGDDVHPGRPSPSHRHRSPTRPDGTGRRRGTRRGERPWPTSERKNESARIGTRRSTWRWPRSTSSSARAPSCGWGRRGRWRSRPSRPGRWRSTWPSASGGLPRGPGRGDLRPGVVRQVHARHARRGRGPAQRRHLRLHRRRARHGPDLRQGHRGRHRPAAHLPARHR